MQLCWHRWARFELRQQVDQVVELLDPAVEGVALLGVNVGYPEHNAFTAIDRQLLAAEWPGHLNITHIHIIICVKRNKSKGPIHFGPLPYLCGALECFSACPGPEQWAKHLVAPCIWALEVAP